MRSALENGSDEARFESPNSQSNELSCLFQCSSKFSKDTVASVKHTGGSGSVRLCKVLEICNSNKSSRQFSVSGKYRKHCLPSYSLLNLRCNLAVQLPSVSVNTFRGPPGIRGGWRPHSYTNTLLSMWYVSMKASLKSISPAIQTFYQQAGRHKNHHTTCS